MLMVDWWRLTVNVDARTRDCAYIPQHQKERQRSRPDTDRMTTSFSEFRSIRRRLFGPDGDYRFSIQEDESVQLPVDGNRQLQ